MATREPETPTTSSPISSPETCPRRRHKNHHKKRGDPFLGLPNISPNKDGCSECEEANSEEESLIEKFIYSPLSFVSFILSLTLVDYRDRRYRSSQHSSPAVSRSSTWFNRITVPLTNLFDPEPYQDPDNTTWQRGRPEDHEPEDEGHGGQRHGDVPHPKRQRWFRRKKHREMARMEIGDAFEMRGKVAIVLAMTVALGALGVAWVVRKIFSRYLW